MPAALRESEHDAAEIVANTARTRVPLGPAVNGHAVTSIQVNKSEVTGGGPRYPYYPWLEFGGRVGPQGSVQRAWKHSGRYLFPALESNDREIENQMDDAVEDAARRSGL